MRRPWGATANAVRAMLQELGPMTMSEIQRELGISRDRVSAVVSRIHASGQTHVQAYTFDDESGKRYPRAVYAWGPGTDVKKPKANKNAVGMRSQKVQRTRIQTSSVFNLGLTRRQCFEMRRVVIGGGGGQDQQ